MTKPQWLYLLRDRPTGEYLYLDSNNTVTYSSAPVGLLYTPDGWQKKTIAWERDGSKWGLGRSFTIPLAFVMDGKTLIEKVSIQQSFEAEIELIIQQLKLIILSSTHQWEYVDFFVGELNLSALDSDIDKVTVSIIEGGVAKKLAANENTAYEIPFQNYITVKMDGINLYDTANFIVTGMSVNLFGPGSIPLNHYLPAAMTTRDGSAAGFAGFQVFAQAIENPATSDKYLFSTTQAITSMRLKGKIKVQLNFNAANVGNKYTVRLVSNLRPGSLTTAIAYLTPGGSSGMSTPSTSNALEIPFDVTFDTSAGENFFIECNETLAGASVTLIEYADSDFHISFASRFQTTYIKAITAWELYQRLIEKITGSAADCDSSLLQAFQNIVITCGDAVRGIEAARIKTSLSEFFTFCKVVFCAGMGIEGGKVVIEALSHFLDTSSPADLGECRNFKWKFAEDLLFNKVKIGYLEKQIDNVNGKYSFNNSHLYSTPIKSVSKQLDLICPYASDPYYIEITRINLEGKTTTDNKADNDVMILNVDTGAATAVQYHAIKSLPQTYSGSADLNHDLAGGYGFTADSTNTEFTYIGTTSQAATIAGVWNFTKPDNSNILYDILINGVSVYHTTIVANSGTSGSGAVPITLNPGDKIKVSFGYAGFGSLDVTVDHHDLIVNLTNVTQYDLKRVSYVTAEGVPDIETLFNIEDLTPKRLFYKWLAFIYSVLWQLVGEDITFETTEKNRSLYTFDGTNIYDEDATEQIYVTPRLFKGIYFNLEAKSDAIVPDTLNTNPNTGFETTNPANGNQFKGIVMKAAFAANELSAQSFRLLADKDTDETLLLE